MRLEIFRGDAERILALAAAAQPMECCGLLLGSGERVDEFVPARNVAADPATRFEVDPEILFAAHRRARDNVVRILGCYHSHPNGDPRPSAEDARQAGRPMIWLIAAGGRLAAWHGGEGAPFAPVDLQILP